MNAKTGKRLTLISIGVTAVAAIAAVLVVPEVRVWIGLDEPHSVVDKGGVEPTRAQIDLLTYDGESLRDATVETQRWGVHDRHKNWWIDVPIAIRNRSPRDVEDVYLKFYTNDPLKGDQDVNSPNPDFTWVWPVKGSQVNFPAPIIGHHAKQQNPVSHSGFSRGSN